MADPRILRPQGSSSFVLFCDHASNYVPPELDDLGLPLAELQRHIAWDIGAAGVTEVLSEILDAPAVLCTTSRLVIDCNRHPDASGLIPETSDGSVIPGNLRLGAAARTARIERYFDPVRSKYSNQPGSCKMTGHDEKRTMAETAGLRDGIGRLSPAV